MNKVKQIVLRYLLDELTEKAFAENNHQLVDCIIVIQDELGWNDK